MFKDVDIEQQLAILRNRSRKEEDQLISEANRILKKDLFAEEKILSNLKQYNSSFETLDEEDLDPGLIFTSSEIRQVAISYRLKFLDNKFFKPEMPYEAVLKIQDLNASFHKDISAFKLLAPPGNFSDKHAAKETILFAKTNYDNYYLIHKWGDKLKWYRKYKFWPLRHFENLVLTVFTLTLIITMSLPTVLITLDRTAGYWSGYRVAAFFHLLIFNTGVTAYLTFAFAKNFSSSVWNRHADFN